MIWRNPIDTEAMLLNVVENTLAIIYSKLQCAIIIGRWGRRSCESHNLHHGYTTK